MFEALQTFFTTSSFLQIFHGLTQFSATDLVMMYLLSKPLFIIAAVGAIISGRVKGDSHYLHFQSCDHFLSHD